MLSRRRLLAAVGLTSVGAILTACGAAPPPTATTAPAKPAEAPKPAAAEPTKPAAPAATTAPAAAPTTPAAATSAPVATKPADTAKPAAAAPSTGGSKATIELWTQKPEWKDAMNTVIKSFLGSNANLEINPTYTASNVYTQQLQTALNAGTGPDIFQSRSRPGLDAQVKAGQLLDLTTAVDQSNWLPVAKQSVTVKGKVYAVSGGKYTVGIAYHQDLFEKAGISAEPKTWAETTQAFEKLKATGVIPYAIEAKDGTLTFFNYIGLASGVLGSLDAFDDVVNGKKKLTDPDLVAVLQQLIDWGKYYQPNFVGTTYLEAKALFASAKTAAMDAGSSDYNGYRQINPNAKLGFMYWPVSDANKKPVTNTGMEFVVSVNAKTKFPEQASLFPKWLGTVPGAQAMVDNVRNLPVLEGVQPKDEIQQKMVKTPLDIPVWAERFNTLNIRTVWGEKGQGLFQDKYKPADFAKLLQDSIDEQMKSPDKPD
jgi:ABC-type glycerol-3-phosphate transport system substrate-binding protein